MVLRCDVTVGDDVSNAFAAAASAEAGLPPVRGIVHAACPPQTGEGEGGNAREGEGASPVVEQRFLGAKVCKLFFFFFLQCVGLLMLARLCRGWGGVSFLFIF